MAAATTSEVIADNAKASTSGGLIREMEQLIAQLERGTIITKFYHRKRPERKTLLLRRETYQIMWSRNLQPANNNYEGCLELREIKEIRIGKISKDFERWPEEAKKIESHKCFVIIYGSEFKLRTLSVAG